MAIRVALNHRTKYRFKKPVWLSPHVIRLRPAPHCRTPVLSYSLKVNPADHFINWQQDPYSNRMARLVFPKQTRDLSIEVDLIADMTVINPFDFFLEPGAEEYPFEYDHVLARELSPYRQTEPPGPLLTAWLEGVGKPGTTRPKLRTVDFLVDLNQRVQSIVKYVIRLEPGIQTPEETLTKGSGSCRDSAWLLVQAMRNFGMAARFVSGYLIQLKPDVKSLDGPSGTDVDFSDLHAWAEAYIPGAGWVGFDPTSGLAADEGHIPLACTADPVSAAAVTGFFSYDDKDIVGADPEDGASLGDGQDDEIQFALSVTRIAEDPRVTKPYTEEQWSAIESLGHQVDADLNRGDVRLTMGGEPTFVSIDDMDGPEWNTLAQGPKKYELADTLIRRLRDRMAPGGFLHHGQGKWYPGESLPRWSLGLYWRKDGQPIWNDPKLVADEKSPAALTPEHGLQFATVLAYKLGVPARYIIPGFEDVWYYLWKERRLPVNVDPFDSKLANPQERSRLSRLLERGLDKVVGHVLPLRRERFADGGGAWLSGSWFFRPERMYLTPGDSAMGYRLPLDSVPWAPEGDQLWTQELDPWADRGPLPERGEISRRSYMAGSPEPILQRPSDPERVKAAEAADDVGDDKGEGPNRDASRARVAALGEIAPGVGEPAPWLVRTALCVEVRGGALRVFLPPQRYLEDFLELISAIEDTAAEIKQPVLVEGYTPPSDHRLNQVKVTPDPGVIEVNTQPVSSWDELVKNTTALYEEARLCRLDTQKFMLDGRHTGTGGGNHIVVGGSTPGDSPLLRRPDLLGSLVGYWHNHPSLSYLFSGWFVGPTSQAPRLDEARNDQTYELEIALSQAKPGTAVSPWTVDRIFRNILVDATGNTHRAEFCIDKLFSPGASSGRLGLLEMRAFEMPPHSRMSLTQHLLLRALIAGMWQRPYREKLVPWGTAIHDRFMLPHFVRQDFNEVLDDLTEWGYEMSPHWFSPHFEFRFPVCGTIDQRGLAVELRQAIEPWNVLGEDQGATATVRYVDSSVERLQVKVDGMTDTRHQVTVNGIGLPLQPTGTNGQFVAGVRFRAWRPPECLHPTIGVHAPLVFDVYDRWSGRSIGGCTYHVSHPGGRNYERFPVNAYEAEGRRVGRFFKFGHTPGPMRVTDPPANRDFPFTLDMRRT